MTIVFSLPVNVIKIQQEQGANMVTKVCVVAGVGPGIGKACCELYSSKGYHVVLMARQQSYLDEVAATLPNTSLSIAVDLEYRGRLN